MELTCAAVAGTFELKKIDESFNDIFDGCLLRPSR